MANAAQEKEWVPRSHVVGNRFGTLSRASAGKMKLFAQLIMEEEEEKVAMEDRPEVGTAFVEVAFINCKDETDGRAYVKIMKDLETRGAKGEAFFQLFELQPGSGVTFSKYMLVSVGSPETFVKLHEDRSPEEVATLTRLVKRYQSTVYTAKATAKMKSLVAEINARSQTDRSIMAVQGHTYTSKVHTIEIAQDPAFAFESGMTLVKKYLTHIKEANLVVRVERVTTADAETMDKVHEAYGSLFAAPHRTADSQPWRPEHRKSIGFSTLPNTPLAFMQKVDDTHTEVVIFDDLNTFGQDEAFGAASDSIKAIKADDKFEAVEVFYFGNTDCKAHAFSGPKFQAHKASPKLDNPISDLLSSLAL